MSPQPRRGAARARRLLALAAAGAATLGAATGVAAAQAPGSTPTGSFEYVSRIARSNDITIRGWAVDRDTKAALAVRVIINGRVVTTVSARASRPDVARLYPTMGALHGIASRVRTSSGEQTVCLSVRNVGGGRDRSLGCRLVIATHPKAMSAPRLVRATAGYGSVTVTWVRPANDGGAPAWEYLVTASPAIRTVAVSGLLRHATITGLIYGRRYTFTVRAVNVAGASIGARSNAAAPRGVAPQTTPAPISTSRYIRNMRGSSAAERATMWREGYTDAIHNPSGHSYMQLLDIGGQDYGNDGILLSASAHFITYENLARDIASYLDGYRRGQRPNAPALVAIGANNDMDVSWTTGAIWARRLVNPLVAHVRGWSSIRIAGADDMEPGFRASYSRTRAWLSGFLASTSAPFVFNGSADGCPWTYINGRCNNGWTMAGLYTLAGGAAPSRIINLPQIYNNTMAAQWKYISLTGVARHQPRIRFGGVLTEWTACAQAKSCYSMTGHPAWNALWRNLRSDYRLRPNSLPWSTDLRIDW